jgi:hypothetical protein
MRRLKRITFAPINPDGFTHKAWCVCLPCYWDDRTDALRGRNYFWDFLLWPLLYCVAWAFVAREVPITLTKRLPPPAPVWPQVICRRCGQTMRFDADYELSGQVRSSWYYCPICGHEEDVD